MSFQARRELLRRVAARYREASRKDRSAILDEFVATTGYDRKYAIRLITRPIPETMGPIRRPRERQYGPELQEALGIAWEVTNGICAKRLVPFLPTLVESLERHGHLVLDEATHEQLMTISAATADRILGARRRASKPRGLSTTRPGSLLKSQIHVRTFADWDDLRAGFMEIDLVGHCGSIIGGSHLYSIEGGGGTQRGTSHIHTAIWRLDFDLGGFPNDVVEQLNFTGSNTLKRAMVQTTIGKDAALLAEPDQLRAWRVMNSSLPNSDGHAISYELYPETSQVHRGPAGEPWTHGDLYLTTYRSCDYLATYNPASSGGCAPMGNVGGFVNGEVVNDVVLWPSVTFHHVPRDEDEAHMDTHWQGLWIVPRDWTATNPIP